MDLLDPITAKDEPDFQQVETTTMAQMQIMIIDPSPYSFDGVRFINITNREAENAGGFVPLSPCLVHIYSYQECLLGFCDCTSTRLRHQSWSSPAGGVM